MSCKHTYNGKRYDSLEEAQAALITPQQKQQALQAYSQYVEQTGKQDIEGFKDFVNKEKIISFDSITEFTNDEKQIILEKISENHKLNIEKAKQFADELLNDDFDKGLEKLRKCYL